MVVHESARRGQLTYGRTSTEGPAQKRNVGMRRDGHDDLGRPIMPYDVFVTEDQGDRPGLAFGRNLIGQMELAFG